ncbi:unnamed protein product [Dracunculus medinensis]|uniref:TRUD domain-containing protein n=1 Tax=Dracunculus medinensis TaxID=318479 RepID=A0A0N4U9J9_DRAME|nr:unnamed protein product [Dracunculus medinensis]
MERDFYITEFVNDNCTEMKCVLKHLYSDFIVNEISSDGTIVIDSSLISTSPSDLMDNNVVNNRNSLSSPQPQQPQFISTECFTEIKGLLNDKSKKAEIDVKVKNRKGNFLQNLTKEERTNIHDWIRKSFNDKLSSRTDLGKITVSHKKDNRKRKYWPLDRPDYLHFTLSKENKDSHYALSLLAKFLRVKIANFGICGTKDRRAITHQKVSIYRVEANRLHDLNMRLRGIKLTNFFYHTRPCRIGELYGNRFSIILRNISEISEEEIKQRIKAFIENGFINYYGNQRFGNFQNTADVGLAILHRKWEEAVRMILKERSASGCLSESLKIWNETNNASLALKKLQGSMSFASIEGQLLNHMSQPNWSYKEALMKLPRSTRSMYIHAYQSLLWNKIFAHEKNYIVKYCSVVQIASKRVRQLGRQLIKGDIDINGNEANDIFSVALPIISSSAVLPKNVVAEWYNDLLNDGAFSLEDFSYLERNFAIGDASRRLFAKPKDVEYQLILYSDRNAKLQPDLGGLIDSEKIGSGPFKALKIIFSLPAGSYATIALRELTRCNMDKLSQNLSSTIDK